MLWAYSKTRRSKSSPLKNHRPLSYREKSKTLLSTYIDACRCIGMLKKRKKKPCCHISLSVIRIMQQRGVAIHTTLFAVHTTLQQVTRQTRITHTRTHDRPSRVARRHLSLHAGVRRSKSVAVLWACMATPSEVAVFTCYCTVVTWILGRLSNLLLGVRVTINIVRAMTTKATGTTIYFVSHTR